MTSARRLSLQIAIVLATIAAFGAGDRAAHKQTKVVEGIVSHGTLQWPEYAALEFRWFKANGVSMPSEKIHWPARLLSRAEMSIITE
jgi:hypothetical protein